MLLVVVDESDLGLELLTTVLVAEFADMASGFLGLSPVPGLDGHGTSAKGSVSTLDGNQGRILLVPDQFSDEADPRVGIFHSAG